MFKIILNNLKKHKIQTIAACLTIILSVAALTSVISLYSGIKTGLNEKTAQLGADLMVIPKEAKDALSDTTYLYTGAETTDYLDGSLEEKIESFDSVKKATAQLYVTLNDTAKSSGCNSDENKKLKCLGIETAEDWVIDAFTEKCSVTDLKDDEVILGANVQGAVGSSITIGNRSFTVKGTLVQSGEAFDDYIILNIDVLRSIIDSSTESDLKTALSKSESDNPVTAFMIELADSTDDIEVDASNAAAVIGYATKVEVLITSGSYEISLSNIKVFFAILGAISVILAIIVIFQIFARFFMSAWTRRKELALYLALGANRSDLRKLIAGEAITLTIAGSIIGLALSIPCYKALLTVLLNADFPYANPTYGTFIAVGAITFAVFLLITAVAIIYPLNKVNKIDPVTTIKQGDID